MGRTVDRMAAAGPKSWGCYELNSYGESFGLRSPRHPVCLPLVLNELRFDFYVPEAYQIQLDTHALWVIPLQLFWLLVFHQFSGILKTSVYRRFAGWPMR